MEEILWRRSCWRSCTISREVTQNGTRLSCPQVELSGGGDMSLQSEILAMVQLFRDSHEGKDI